MTLTEITITELRNISHDSSDVFNLLIKDKVGRATTFTSKKIVRCLPEKRISCIGIWQDKTVFAKIFISKQRSKIHCLREQQGFDLLSKNQITAPQILQVSSALNNEVHIILFDFIDLAVSAQTAWNRAPVKTHLKLLEKLLTLIAEHHNKGIIQNDLHLDNFLLSNDTVFTLDGSDISNSQLSLHQALDNLALFFAQFYPENDVHIKQAFLHYGSLRNWKIEQQLIDRLFKLTQIKREKRKTSFFKKIYRECSLFSFKNKWDQLTVCNRNYLTKEMLELIKYPDNFIDNGEFLKKGNSTTISVIALNDRKFVIKRYNTKNIIHAIRRAFRQSRASISWKNAHMLNFYGIPTTKPIALIENRWGFIQKNSYYITEFQQGETCLNFFRTNKHSEQDKTYTANTIVETLKKIHGLRITHGDLKTTNMIISDLQPTLIDLDSMRQHSNKLSFKKAQNKDILRFFKNWNNDKSNSELFRKIYSEY